jgi:hypothetical protein
VYGYQSLKAGQQAEQLLGGFVRRGAALPLDSPAPVVASKYFTIPVSALLRQQAIAEAPVPCFCWNRS